MHPITKSTLETLQRWTVDVAVADRFLTALTREIPERQDDDTVYCSVDTSFGTSFTVTIYGAAAIEDAKPFMAAVRRAGFKRNGDMKEKPAENAVEWPYVIQVDDEHRIDLTVNMRLATADTTATSRCRYVEVGKKEVPDMRLLCGDELAAWEAQQVTT